MAFQVTRPDDAPDVDRLVVSAAGVTLGFGAPAEDHEPDSEVTFADRHEVETPEQASAFRELGYRVEDLDPAVVVEDGEVSEAAEAVLAENRKADEVAAAEAERQKAIEADIVTPGEGE